MLSNTIVVTFAGTAVHKKIQEQFDSLYSTWFKSHIGYTGEWLVETDFFKDNYEVFQHQKYFGYFLWKPYIIKHTLEQYPESNILYCDSNIRFSNFGEFENIYNSYIDKQGVFLVKHKVHLNKTWIKRDTFSIMEADNKRYWNAQQAWSVISGWTLSKKRLLDEYLKYCKMEQVVSDTPSEQRNLSDFKEHRWEQAVLSILAEKHKIDAPFDVDMFRFVNKIYPKELLEFKSAQ